MPVAFFKQGVATKNKAVVSFKQGLLSFQIGAVANTNGGCSHYKQDL